VEGRLTDTGLQITQAMTIIDPHLWTIILAAGDGTRLLPLTRAIHGEDLPKQFARLCGDKSLLQRTVLRAMQWSAPERIVVVVARDRERLAAEQLASHGRFDLVAQPTNLGTGPGLLLPLVNVLAKNHDARVVILPSDHFVKAEEAFAAALHRAVTRVTRTGGTVLIGATPENAEEQYGWIVPCRERTPGVFGVSSFREKPDAAAARELAANGALWSTFVLASRAHALVELARATIPAQVDLFEDYRRAIYTSRRLAVLSDIYSRMTPADFSRNVLEHSRDLEVVPLPPCGWSDWGTPERVLESLRGTSAHEELLRRLEEASCRIDRPRPWSPRPTVASPLPPARRSPRHLLPLHQPPQRPHLPLRRQP
jgi:mannose-1-phosphate guanylyltransferase